jgi:hypothetical protein
MKIILGQDRAAQLPPLCQYDSLLNQANRAHRGPPWAADRLVWSPMPPAAAAIQDGTHEFPSGQQGGDTTQQERDSEKQERNPHQVHPASKAITPRSRAATAPSRTGTPASSLVQQERDPKQQDRDRAQQQRDPLGTATNSAARAGHGSSDHWTRSSPVSAGRRPTGVPNQSACTGDIRSTHTDRCAGL